MARWNHGRWIVAAHPLVDGCGVMTMGLGAEARLTRAGAAYRRFRVDAGGDAVAFGNAYVDRGRVSLRLEAPLGGVERIDFEADADGLAVPGTGRMMRAGRWEPLTVLPEANP